MDPAPQEPAAGCPPPLAWRDVVAAVETGGRPLECRTPEVDLKGVSFGQGPPLWLLGGWTGDWRLGSLVAWLLRDQFQCLLIDLAPGRQSVRKRDWFAACGRALNAAAVNLGAGPGWLCSHSEGTFTAVHALAAGPAQFRGAVLQNPIVEFHPSLIERGLAWLGEWSGRPVGQRGLWRELQAHNHSRWLPPFDASRWEFLVDALGRTPTRTLCYWRRSAAGCGVRELLPTIAQPMLVLDSEGAGPRLSAASREFESLAPNARRTELHHTGLFPCVTHPHRIAKVIADFVSGALGAPCAETSSAMRVHAAAVDGGGVRPPLATDCCSNAVGGGVSVESPAPASLPAPVPLLPSH